MTLYEVIIKEFSDDDNIKNLGKLFSGNPIDNGVSEEEFRSTFVNAVGYDPTTMYDFKKIDDMVDAIASKSSVDADNAKESSKRRFTDEKDLFMSRIVSDEMHVLTNAVWDSTFNENRSLSKHSDKLLDDYNNGKIDSHGNPIDDPDDFDDDDDDFDDIDINENDFDDEDDEEV